MKTGYYVTQKEEWLSSFSANSFNALGHSTAIIDWTNDSESLDCSVVWPEYDRDPTQDFGAAYFEMASPVVEIQLAKGIFSIQLVV